MGRLAQPDGVLRYGTGEAVTMRSQRTPRRLWVRAGRILAVVAVLVAPLTASAVRTPAALPAPPAGAALPVQAASTHAVPPDRPGAPGRRPSGHAPASGDHWRVLQMNLCNSGRADCYARFNNGRSVAEAYGVIRSTDPDLVTLNEICRSDAMDGLLPAMRENWPGDWVFASFMPAYDRRTGGPYRCADGDQYGLGILGHVPGAGWHGVYGFGGIYPDSYAGLDTQDTGSNEERAWLCTYAAGSYYGCTTHLSSSDRGVAANQCWYMMAGIVPSLRSRQGGTVPAVLGGDLNLTAGGRPDVQDCVPPGWFRKGDGEVQHVMATTGLAFDFGRGIEMRHTDHPAWLVGLRPN
jgi:hypothetical protein